MFIECEKWRVEFKLEQLKHSFVFEEREKVNQYYPQYYHKTDNVSPCLPPPVYVGLSILRIPCFTLAALFSRDRGLIISGVDHYTLSN